MKKAVRSSTGVATTIQAAPAAAMTASAKQSASRPQAPSPTPTPVWSRYVDSRLKQFCLR